MRNKTYFISDLHWGHTNILKYSPDTRGKFKDIDEHDRYIVDEINNVVRRKDTLWILGDVALGVQNLSYRKWINSDNVNLVMGNHDTYNIMDYIAAGFQKIQGMVSYKEFVLSHMPVHEQQLSTRYKYNIHGHLHGTVIPDMRYYNVNIDVAGFKPIWVEDIRSELKHREKFGIVPSFNPSS